MNPSGSCPICQTSAPELWLRAPDRFNGRKHLYHLVRCRACSLVRLADPPPPEEMSFHYGPEYHKSIKTAGEARPDRRWKRHRSTILSIKQEGAILDIGCSTGAFLRTMKDGKWALHGVEISAEEAQRARLSGAEIFVGDPLDASFPPESFDVITCFHLLEHVYDPLALLRRVRIWLKPDGILYVVLPNIESWEARIFQSYWYGLELPRHLFHFSPSSLKEMAGAANLRTLQLRTLVEDSFSEHSFHYLTEDLLAAAGISKQPLNAGLPASFTLRVVRKLFRLSIESVFRWTAASAGHGASIEAIFAKHPAGLSCYDA